MVDVHDDACLRQIASDLTECSYAVLDGFLGDRAATLLRERCLNIGRSTASPSGFEVLTSKLSTLVASLGKCGADELAGISLSSCALSCLRAGGGQGKHVDLPGRHPGRLSVVYYLQEDSWDAASNSGRLRIYKSSSGTEALACDEAGADPDVVAVEGALADIAPIRDRLVLFFSDDRCPHAVSPLDAASGARYAAVVFCQAHGSYERGGEEEDVVYDWEAEPLRLSESCEPTDTAAYSSPIDERLCMLEEIYEALGPTATNFSGLGSAELALLSSKEHGGEGAHVYGDTEGELVAHLFGEMRPAVGIAAEEDVVICDLGSGNGKLLLQLALLTPARRLAGVELSATRHAQATAALAQAAERQVLSPARARSIELSCGSMLDHAALCESTQCFCYSLALDTPFMEALEAHLARTLPMGALVLLRGKRFPGGTWAEPGTGASRRGMQPVLETRIVNRMHQFYGYRIADAGAAPPDGAADAAAELRLLELEQRSAPLAAATSREFVRSFFAPTEPDVHELPPLF